jgi:hypothetical protein
MHSEEEEFPMKVNYPIPTEANLKAIKEALKPFGGRCAKFVDGKLEYQISEEQAAPAYEHLKEQGFVS